MRSTLKQLAIAAVLTLSLSFIVSLKASCQTNNLNRIKLTWNAFSKVKANTLPYITYISHKTMYKYRAIQNGNRLSLDFVVGVTVDTAKTIVNITRLNTLNATDQRALLNHEQGHSDLAVIYGRELYNQLCKQTYTVANYKEETRAIYTKLMEQLENINARYDMETEHGNLVEKQKKWNAYFKDRLN